MLAFERAFTSCCVVLAVLAPLFRKRKFGVEAQFLVSWPPSSAGHCVEFSLGSMADVSFSVLFSYFSTKWEPLFLERGRANGSGFRRAASAALVFIWL